ncbi:MAG: hypothetical protein QMC99_05860 [Methanocella conradii]|nr:hypothetical protein [Methanocella conradii]
MKCNIGEYKFWVYSTMVVIIHSALLCVITVIDVQNIDWLIQSDIYGHSVAWLLQSSVSHSYLLGPILQPSMFGIFIIVSILLFLYHRPYIAEIVLMAVATIHSIYLLTAGALTLSYAYLIFSERKSWKEAVIFGCVALILVSPILILDYINFSPQSLETMSLSNYILVHFRYPWHAIISDWFCAGTILQVAIIIVAIYLCRKERIFSIILIPFIVSAVLTIVQALTNSDSLAFLMPWRVTAILIPLSTCIILAYAVDYIFRKFKSFIDCHKKALIIACGIILIIFCVYGVYHTFQCFTTKSSSNEIPVMDFVKQNKSLGDVYLIPTDLQDFRLYTGAPIFVDFKSHPYKDTEVIEWYKRLQLANDFYNNTSYLNNTDTVQALRNITKDYRITHIIIRGYDPKFSNETITLAYTDGNYTIYKINNI